MLKLRKRLISSLIGENRNTIIILKKPIHLQTLKHIMANIKRRISNNKCIMKAIKSKIGIKTNNRTGKNRISSKLIMKIINKIGLNKTSSKTGQSRISNKTSMNKISNKLGMSKVSNKTGMSKTNSKPGVTNINNRIGMSQTSSRTGTTRIRPKLTKSTTKNIRETIIRTTNNTTTTRPMPSNNNINMVMRVRHTINSSMDTLATSSSNTPILMKINSIMDSSNMLIRVRDKHMVRSSCTQGIKALNSNKTPKLSQSQKIHRQHQKSITRC